MIGDNEGSTAIKGISDRFTGSLTDISVIRLARGFIANVQWYPNDTGLFDITFSKFIQLIDTERLEMCETFHFGTLEVFWSDWNPNDSNLIAVAASSSTVRFVDVRSGDNLQQIVVPSLMNAKEHTVTRVLWDRMDSEALIVSDSSGYLHIFDIRNPRHAVISTHSDSSLGMPIVCLQHANDHQIITCHGFHQNMIKWTFQNKQLVNTHVNFDTLRPSHNKSGTPSFLKTSILVTDCLVFSPAPPGKGDMLINDINSGKIVKRLSTDTFFPSKQRRTNAVNGLCANSPTPVIFTGGKNNFKVWNHTFDQTACDEPFATGNEWKNVVKELKIKTENPLHIDDWSDSE